MRMLPAFDVRNEEIELPLTEKLGPLQRCSYVSTIRLRHSCTPFQRLSTARTVGPQPVFMYLAEASWPVLSDATPMPARQVHQARTPPRVN